MIEIIREKGYSKINVQEILNDNFERKPYMSNLSSDDAKMRFKNLKPDGSESENELSVRQKVYFGPFCTFWALRGYFWGWGQVQKLFWYLLT